MAALWGFRARAPCKDTGQEDSPGREPLGSTARVPCPGSPYGTLSLSETCCRSLELRGHELQAVHLVGSVSPANSGSSWEGEEEVLVTMEVDTAEEAASAETCPTGPGLDPTGPGERHLVHPGLVGAVFLSGMR